jgi:hypothetical protein
MLHKLAFKRANVHKRHRCIKSERVGLSFSLRAPSHSTHSVTMSGGSQSKRTSHIPPFSAENLARKSVKDLEKAIDDKKKAINDSIVVLNEKLSYPDAYSIYKPANSLNVNLQQMLKYIDALASRPPNELKARSIPESYALHQDSIYRCAIAVLEYDSRFFEHARASTQSSDLKTLFNKNSRRGVAERLDKAPDAAKATLIAQLSQWLLQCHITGNRVPDKAEVVQQWLTVDSTDTRSAVLDFISRHTGRDDSSRHGFIATSQDLVGTDTKLIEAALQAKSRLEEVKRIRKRPIFQEMMKHARGKRRGGPAEDPQAEDDDDDDDDEPGPQAQAFEVDDAPGPQNQGPQAEGSRRKRNAQAAGQADDDAPKSKRGSGSFQDTLGKKSVRDIAEAMLAKKADVGEEIRKIDGLSGQHFLDAKFKIQDYGRKLTGNSRYISLYAEELRKRPSLDTLPNRLPIPKCYTLYYTAKFESEVCLLELHYRFLSWKVATLPTTASKLDIFNNNSRRGVVDHLKEARAVAKLGMQVHLDMWLDRFCGKRTIDKEALMDAWLEDTVPETAVTTFIRENRAPPSDALSTALIEAVREGSGRFDALHEIEQRDVIQELLKDRRAPGQRPN